MRDLDLSKFNSRILSAEAGVERVIHILAPVLKERLAGLAGSRVGKDATPVVAVRSSKHGFKKAMLVRHVELLGPSAIEERFLNPLPGTNGRGVVPLVTSHAIVVYFEGDHPTVIDVDDVAVPAKDEQQPKHKTRKKAA